MDINWLVQRLKHGEVYQAQNPEGETYQVNRPPTSISIKAADVIQQLSNQLQQNAEINQNLMRQLHDANSHLETLYKQRDQEAQAKKE
jgi:uncharacterized membrane protein YgaE (UPF0421/DUF939 family)